MISNILVHSSDSESIARPLMIRCSKVYIDDILIATNLYHTINACNLYIHVGCVNSSFLLKNKIDELKPCVS